MTIEKRHQPRCRCDLPAHLIHRGRAFPIRISDIAAGGLGIRAGRLALPSGNLIEVELRLNGATWSLHGLIVHTGAPRIGVMFKTPQPALFSAATQAGSAPSPMRTTALGGALSPPPPAP
ncbi:MAG: PilZ domain-containing protein [Candidatus Sedimenticola endophacoides]